MFWESILGALTHLQWAEAGAVVAGIIYVVLAARQNVWCWLFGIVGSALSIYLFYISRLYAESALYLYYVAAGVYGWYAWTHERLRAGEARMAIIVWRPRQHLAAIVLGAGLSAGLGFILHTRTDAAFPWVDAHTTIFSFLATYLVTRKVLGNWVYWIVIDAVSAGLYAARELYLYALLMALYTVIAVWGYRAWRRQYQKEQAGASQRPA